MGIYSSLPYLDCVYLFVDFWCDFWTGGAVVFLVGLNKQFSPLLNDRNGLGMCPQGFLVFLGAGPDCITGPVTRTDCVVYRGGHSHTMAPIHPAPVICTVTDRNHARYMCV